MEREVRLTYDDSAGAGDFPWSAQVTIRIRSGHISTTEEFDGFGTTPAEALDELASRLKDR